MTSRSNTTRVSGHARLTILIAGGIVTLSINTASAQPNVPDGFTIHEVTTFASAPYLQDVEPGPGGAFGTYLYFIVSPDQIYRVDPWGGPHSLFATIPGAQLASLRSGFDGDLYAVDGQYYVPSTVYRIRADGTSSVFSTVSPPPIRASERIEYSAGGPFGNQLFVSEFDNCISSGNPVYAIDSTGARSELARLTTVGCNRLTGLAFGPGGNFGTDLFGIFLNTGRIYKIAPGGTYGEFVVKRRHDRRDPDRPRHHGQSVRVRRRRMAIQSLDEGIRRAGHLRGDDGAWQFVFHPAHLHGLVCHQMR